MNNERSVCPVCGQYTFEGEYDICKACFWEDDPIQEYEPDYGGGANNLCLNDYKKWWQKLNRELPPLMQKYGVTRRDTAGWRFDKLIVPRGNIRAFIAEASSFNIALQADFYHLCEAYGYDSLKFAGTAAAFLPMPAYCNREMVALIFSANPIAACEKYGLKQLAEILKKSDNPRILWEQLTPDLSVAPNSKYLANE